MFCDGYRHQSLSLWVSKEGVTTPVASQGQGKQVTVTNPLTSRHILWRDKWQAIPCE